MESSAKILLIVSIIAFCLSGCAEDFELDYTAPVKIEFSGVNSDNIIKVEKGVLEYIAQIKVQGDIQMFEIYEADAKTGKEEKLIEGKKQIFENGVSEYETTYQFEQLENNKCIKVVVLGMDGRSYQRNLLVEITPSVLFSEPDYGQTGEIIETVSSYYGCYYATWKLGRVYMNTDAEKYVNEIDFSLSDLTIGNEIFPALVSPAKRGDYNFSTIIGLQNTLFAETELTINDFNAISRIDASLIKALAAPISEVVEVKEGKIYLFETSNSKKGLILIQKINVKTGTVELAPNNWVENMNYHQILLLTKTIVE